MKRHPWRTATAMAVAEKQTRPAENHRLLDEYERFFAQPVGTHVDIKPDALNRWRCAATWRKCWHQAKKRRNGMIRFWNLGPQV